MDFNDINLRIQRLYKQLDKQFEFDLNSNTKTTIDKQDGRVAIKMSFGTHDKTELNNRFFDIVNALASLKDHLKNTLKKINRDPVEVEELISNSVELQLLMDLWNQDKHGYPLTKATRSNRNPKIIDIGQALTFVGNVDNTEINRFPQKGPITASRNGVIKITGKIVDGEGNFLMYLDELIDKTVNQLEVFMKKRNLKA